MSIAKKAVDNTLRRILNYTAEIIIAIILLIVICIPLVFAIPMWFQHVLFDVPRPELSVNPVSWFGALGSISTTLLLGLVSFSISYIYILKMKPGYIAEEAEEKVDSSSLDEESVDSEYETALEDIEDEEEIALEDQEIEELSEEDSSLEDQEDDSDFDIEDLDSEDD